MTLKRLRSEEIAQMDVRTIVHRKLRNNSAVILRRVQRCAFTAFLRHLWVAPS